MEDQILEKLGDLLKKQSKDINELVAEFKKQFRAGTIGTSDTKAFLKEIKNLEKTSKNLNESQRKEIASLDEFTKTVKTSKRIMSDFNSTLGRISDTLFGLGDASVTGAERIGYYTKAFQDVPFVGQAVNALGQSIDFNVDVFKALASLGADFGQSLVNLRIGSRDTLLPLMEFVDLIKDNSNNLALLFGTVNQGTARLSQLSREVRANLLPQFANFGVTTEEINDYLTTFLALQRVQGRQEFLSTEATTEALASYTGELDKVSKLTGIQRQELDKAVRAQQADAVLQSYLAGLAPERRQEVQTFIAGLQQLSPALGGAVSNILATGFPLGEFEQNLVALNPGLAESIQAFKEGTMSSEEFNNRLRTIAGNTARFGSGLLRANENVLAVTNSFLPLRGTLTDFASLQEQRNKAEDGTTGQVILLQESFRRFKSQIEGIQTTLLQQTLPTLAEGFGMSAKTLDTLGTAITKFGLEYPNTLTGAVIAAQALRYSANYGKEIGLNAAGVAAGIRLAGPGGFFGSGGRGSSAVGAVGRGIGTVGRALPVAGAVGTAGYNAYELMDDDPENNKRAILGLIGTAAGGLLGVIGGPMGVAIGATIGNTVGNMLGSMIEPRYGGGSVMTGSQYLVGESGPELFTPKNSGTITSNADLTAQTAQMSKFSQMFGEQNAAFKQFAELSAKMEKHLNTLVSINARTETNTNTTARRLANMGDNLV